MNEQDREALDSITDIGSPRYNETRAHLVARLTHLDKLERAMAWREAQGEKLQWWNGHLVFFHAECAWHEPHDGTPQGRGEALVRLWQRCGT